LNLCLYAQEETDLQKQKDGEDRNVMLNASDANKPREIQIGLPSEDVNVYENGLPAVYSSSLHNVSTHWRSDASLGTVTLLNPSESAITTGNIAYSVSSFTHLGQKEFGGKINYMANHFGLQQFDLNLSGNIGDKWLYAGSIYQNFDPGSYKLKFTNFVDRTQIYKAALTRTLDNNRGKITLLYRYSNSRRLTDAAGEAPFIYVGDGSIKEIPGIKLGRTSYLPADGKIKFLDMISGREIEASLYDYSLNKANEISLLSEFNFNNGAKLTLNGKYMRAYASFYAIGGTAISDITNGKEEGVDNPDAPLFLLNGENYTGKKQGRIAYNHEGDIDNLLFNAELTRQSEKHNWRIGLNQWWYRINYTSNTTQFDQTVTPYPNVLSHTTPDETPLPVTYFGYNVAGSEYYDGYENKLALYFTDNWQPSTKWDVYYGARIEYYKLDGKNLPFERIDNFRIGAEVNGEKIEPRPFSGDYINYALTAQGIYHLNNSIGFTADATYSTHRPRIQDYAGQNNPDDKQISISLVRGGVLYRNQWVNLTSMVTYIQKNNNYQRMNINNPAPGSTEVRTAAFNYDIRTIGWTTNMEVKPFKDFSLHLLFTLQNPTYRKYESAVDFADGTTGSINATGNVVTDIPKVLIEIDPTYNITKDLRLWASFRYFGKTYANLSNALYFNSRWETFAGVNYKVNEKLTINLTAINLLNQRGASGSIAGSELIRKEDSAKYNNHWMYGKYLRPFTIEFSANIRF